MIKTVVTVVVIIAACGVAGFLFGTVLGHLI